MDFFVKSYMVLVDLGASSLSDKCFTNIFLLAITCQYSVPPNKILFHRLGRSSVMLNYCIFLGLCLKEPESAVALVLTLRNINLWGLLFRMM